MIIIYVRLGYKFNQAIMYLNIENAVKSFVDFYSVFAMIKGRI